MFMGVPELRNCGIRIELRGFVNSGSKYANTRNNPVKMGVRDLLDLHRIYLSFLQLS